MKKEELAVTDFIFFSSRCSLAIQKNIQENKEFLDKISIIGYGVIFLTDDINKFFKDLGIDLMQLRYPVVLDLNNFFSSSSVITASALEELIRFTKVKIGKVTVVDYNKNYFSYFDQKFDFIIFDPLGKNRKDKFTVRKMIDIIPLLTEK